MADDLSTTGPNAGNVTADPPEPAGAAASPKGGRGKAKDTKETLSSAARTVSEEASKAKANATETLKQGAEKIGQQASDRARGYAQQGKAKATDALEEFSRLMDNAAGSVDERLGSEYGDYARSAARSISGFADSLKAKDVDDLLADARNFVKKSPGIAIGTAAAIGFVLARLVKSGLDADNRQDNA